jgi:hypothetical protein
MWSGVGGQSQRSHRHTHLSPDSGAGSSVTISSINCADWTNTHLRVEGRERRGRREGRESMRGGKREGRELVRGGERNKVRSNLNVISTARSRFAGRRSKINMHGEYRLQPSL